VSCIYQVYPFQKLDSANTVLIIRGVNFEGGSVVANHLNETPGVSIRVKVGKDIIDTKELKFGALVGDGCNIGANSVLSPGTVLEPNTMVPRLTLVKQT
jgi:UDP-N-acetylglucosamine diphosphorylase / glucose-1-phosphate thymidylyltransferase / UDP-N-acetylgalactosamine diphosphorylase / glucosamine-1-phosphate N-acetyltransferase / galactosamine-1-phosphate N-acetyltransferase